MTALDPETRALLQAPLDGIHGPARLGGSVLLYIALILAANDQGLVIRTVTQFARDLSVPESEINAWVARLANAKLIQLLSPSPYLAIRLRFWSAEGFPVAENPELSAEKRDSYSSSKALALSSNTGVGGQGEGEKLRDEIRAVLPDAESTEIERILIRFPHAVLRKTLDRVAKTPPEKIRKSKTALFRFLLAKFSEEIDVNDL